MLDSFLSLPPEQLALLRLVADDAAARGVTVYVVGGFVRDLVLGRPGLDLDIVVEGDAIALARALARKHGGRLTAHKKFGTATWSLDRSISDLREPHTQSPIPTIDFITARRETYALPAALPDVVPSTLSDDLRRRDFTINTLAMRLDGAHFGDLVDEYGGLSDLQRGVVRVLHDGSFIDDPTRMYRAARYEQRYNFKIEPHTLRLVEAARGTISRLSSERARHELDVVFDEAQPAAVLARFHRLGLLAAASPALPWDTEISRRVETGLRAVPPAGWGLESPAAGLPLRRALGYSLWLLELAPAQIDALESRLSFPGALLKAVRATSSLWTDLPALKGGPASKWVDRLDGLPMTAIFAVWLSGAEPALEAYVLRWRHVHPQADGGTLKRLGLPPGPGYKKILRRLRAAWLDGEVASDAQEQDLLERLLAT